MIPSRVIWAVPILLTLHNVEEALTLRTELPTLSSRLPSTVRAVWGPVPYTTFLTVLAVVTVLVFALAAWAATRPRGLGPWLVAAVQAAVALNVLVHVGAAVRLRGYAPGLLTAVLINAPFTWYFFRRAAREHWLSRSALWTAVPAAIVLHGPGLVGLFVLVRSVAAAAQTAPD